jgi:DNA-directed RNA polymerases I, II, and III subunit RPABC3
MLVREAGGNEAEGGEVVGVAIRPETASFNRRFGGGGGSISCTLYSVSGSSHLDRLREAGEGAFMIIRSLKTRLAMSSGPSNVLFDDLFTINDIDREGKKFDRGTIQLTSIYLYSYDNSVSRLSAQSSNFEMSLTLDFNIELYPLQKDEKFSFVLASSLARSGPSVGVGVIDGIEEDDKDRDVWRPDGKGRRGLEEDYEYVMYGKVRRVCDCPQHSGLT